MAKRGSGRRPSGQRHFPRAARISSLVREIVGDYFERVDDEELGLLTITGVEVDNDMNRAEVFVSLLGDELPDEDVLDLLEERHRKPLQREINNQSQLRKTPQVAFSFDHGVRSGSRIDEILRTMAPTADGDDTVSDGDDTVSDGDDTVSDGDDTVSDGESR